MENNPYSPPLTKVDAPSAAALSGTYGAFRNNGTLKSIVVSLLILDSMLIIFNSGILNYLDIQQAQSDTYWQSDEPSQLDNIIDLTGSAHAILSVTMMVFFAIWINRSCKNAWLLDPPRMSITPGWSVGYYFIPILSLWKPYVAMKQIRSASYGSDHALRRILPIWWTLWILSNMLGQIVFRLYLDTKSDESYLMACKLDFVSVPVDIILNYIAIVLVTGITMAQQRRTVQWHAV